jgi:mRNA interferase MazF
MTGYKRGDVVLAIFPNSDRQTFKKRPVLVVQSESVRTYFGQTIVAPITSNQGLISPAMLPVKVGSPEHKSMGLLLDSVINLETLTTLVPREIAGKIGSCGSLLNFDPPLRALLGL